MRRGGAGAGSGGLRIERFSVFGGVLHVAGWLPAAAQALELILPGGEVLALRLGPDRIGFDQALPVPAGPAEIAHARLRATLDDATVAEFEGLGSAVTDPAHDLSRHFQAAMAARPPGRLLEIGSRARSGVTRRDWAQPGWDYSGFDIKSGPNVDVVGDAHALSRHYPAAQFDAVMAFSVLEHLLMPWKFVIELNRVLKPGAVGLFTTHQCWPLHDQPWDFWRFSDTAWAGLLNAATGFEVIAARMGEPAYLVAQRCSPATAFAEHPAGALASFVFFRKIGETRLEWPVELSAITATAYPV